MTTQATKNLLKELEALSQILTDLGEERNDPIFLGLSQKVDELMEDYNETKRARQVREQDFIDAVTGEEIPATYRPGRGDEIRNGC